MSTTSTPGETTERRRRKRRPRRRRALWITLSILFALIVVAVVGGVMAYQTFEKAQVVRAKLTAAIPLVGQVRDELTSFDVAGSTATAAQLGQLTADARAETDSPVWRIMEIVPVLGPNLAAVRTATEVADDISTDIVTPLASTSIDQLKPVDSKIDIAAVTTLSEKITVAKATIDSAESRITGIDRSALLPEVASAVGEIQPQLVEATRAMDAVEPITSILPDSLGASGPRQYLVLFQNLAEVQPLGGGTAALMLLKVDNGTITISRQADSYDFDRTLTPPVNVDQSAINAFGANIGSNLNTSTVRPDFPTAASIATQFWQRTYPEDGTINGVLAVDPKALSYLIGSTGPITLLDGTVLTSDNTVKTLLHDVYLRDIGDANIGEESDKFFAMASATIMDQILGGGMEPSKMLPAIVKGVDERRILAFSNDADEQALLAATPIAGILPTDNTTATTTGVFFQDASSGAKMDYYLDTDVQQSSTNLCAADATFSTTVTLTNTVTTKEAATLNGYVLSNKGLSKPEGRFITQVYVLGPPGTTFTSLTFNQGNTLSFDVGATDDLGRPVARAAVYLDPGETNIFTATFNAGATTGFAPQDVVTTPTLNATTVTIAPDASCPAG
ncbi:DUF4012 domain-containing protein [Microbacteriaceae bacterium VKM Ac-2855]|nr:DUF4012 domain-containing protein [Microbacteriaceae bacterium VKM Ac-2855]